ncbi:MAG: NADPH-dependent F420 reductase [Candidatus Limnocylindrales bacterium]
MDIAIIGAGNVGKALATAFIRAGHNVSITASGASHALEAAAATGARPVGSNAEAALTAGVIVLAIPFDSAAAVAQDIRDEAAGKAVVDVTNRMSFGANGPEIDTTSSNAEELARLLPDAHVVKAFNTVFASRQADPVTEGIRLDGFVAGDDEGAKAAVLRLVESIGLEPVDVGPLVRARQLEALAFLNIALNATHGGAWQSGWKLVAAPATIPVGAGV